MTIQLERPITPDSEDTIHEWIHQLKEDFHTAIPGRVHAVDWTHGTVDVEPTVRHAVLQSDGSTLYEDLPILPAVPLIMPSVGDWFLSLPIAPGDTVLVVFCESAIGQWRIGDGSPQYPGDLERHSLSHAVAIPGLRIRNAAFETPQSGGGALAEDLVLGKSGGTQITIRGGNGGDAGQITVTQGSTVVAKIDATGTVHLGGAVGSAVAIASGINTCIQALSAAINGWSPVANDGGAALKTALTTWLSTYASPSFGATKTDAV